SRSPPPPPPPPDSFCGKLCNFLIISPPLGIGFVSSPMDASEYLNPSVRTSKKRDLEDQSLQLASANKRVALGEITNSLIFNTRQCSLSDQEMTDKDMDEEERPDGTSVDCSKKCRSASSIYNHLRSLEMELHMKVLPNNIVKAQNGDSILSFTYMREILVDWLVEVAEEYKLVSDTLYLTISHMDIYLSSQAVDKSKLQLLGVCCMLLASKYEEINPPNVEDFCYITDNTYTKEQVLSMEREVRKFLSCEGAPTIKNFLRQECSSTILYLVPKNIYFFFSLYAVNSLLLSYRIFTQVSLENWKAPDLQFEFLSCYLAELSLLDHRFAQFLPSMVAASAIFLSRFTIQPDKHPWCLALQHYSGYRPSELKECILAIHRLQLNRKGSSLQAIRTKYKQHKFKCVAELSSPSEIPAYYFEDIDKQSFNRFLRT
ncbi:Cyclin-A3-4, partial [Cucurbita argyrosperma subsp. argyrosperma]